MAFLESPHQTDTKILKKINAPKCSLTSVVYTLKLSSVVLHNIIVTWIQISLLYSGCLVQITKWFQITILYSGCLVQIPKWFQITLDLSGC